MQGSHSPFQSMAPKPKVKLLIDTSTNKVLFGEANKDFIDFLFTLLAYPIGHITELLTEKRMAGSIGSLYKSLKDLPIDYMLPNADKNLYLKPKLSIPINRQGVPLIRLQEEPPPRQFTTSSPISTSAFFLEVKRSICPQCRRPLDSQTFGIKGPETASSSSSSSSEEGCVKGMVTYMVMDNLEVSPMSAISSMALLNKFHVKDVGALVEKVVEVGINEGLALLQASMESKTVLTDVFGEKPKTFPI